MTNSEVTGSSGHTYKPAPGSGPVTDPADETHEDHRNVPALLPPSNVPNPEHPMIPEREGYPTAPRTGQDGRLTGYRINVCDQRRPEDNRAPTGSRKGTFNFDPDCRRTPGFMTLAGVYTGNMPSRPRWKCDSSFRTDLPPVVGINIGLIFVEIHQHIRVSMYIE
ncbi:hypothetical protein Bbelb_025530 [Branchiostoma belcheri]|nr:hypothetical protein Bbelb_025530 [Branchiostoma belcheri]